MEIVKENQSKIVSCKTELWVPHNDGEEVFYSQPIGLFTHKGAGRQILKKGMNIPTGDEMASLVYSAYFSNNSDKPEFITIRNINGLWTFNRNLYTEKGVYVLQDSYAEGNIIPLEEMDYLNGMGYLERIQVHINDLEERLKDGREISGVRFSKDEKLRFAPKGSYLLGKKFSPNSYAKDGFSIASHGKEGAEKQGEVYAKKQVSPFNYGFEIKRGMKPVQTVSAFMDPIMPGIDGRRASDVGFNYSFGVLPKA
jgi:hypothetical protein